VLFKDSRDRKPLVILPQLLTGFILGFIYIKYGFVMTLLIHLTYDFIILATDKKQNTIGANFLNSIFWLLVFGVTSWILNSNGINTIDTVRDWFTQSEVLQKPTENLWLMGVVLLNFASVFHFLTHFLGLDRTSKTAEGLEKLNLVTILIAAAVGCILASGLILGLNWVAGLFVTNFASRAILVATALTFLSTPKSGSAMANLWFTDIPITFLQVFIALAFGFWPSVLIFIVASLPNFVSEYIDA
jgi:hypothetical protein